MDPSISTAGAATAATYLKSSETAVQAQVALLKNALDVQAEAAAALLEMLGVGRSLDVRA